MADDGERRTEGGLAGNQGTGYQEAMASGKNTEHRTKNAEVKRQSKRQNG
jgi:hypothetical protein